MENQRTIILAAVSLAMLTPSWLFAYEPNTTHDALTYEAANFYNVYAKEYGTPSISDADRALMQKGAMDEDDDYRMAHHFYDPVHHTGLKGYISSKVWAESPAYQASWKNGPAGCLPRPHVLFPLYESPCDYSWQRAIYDYAYGDEVMKERALEALGHTLHLIEDASVPDHTRNDAHIPVLDEAIQRFDEGFGEKSPFEDFTNKFSIASGNVTTTQQLLKESARPYVIDSLGAYFDNTARYSNSNFFSKSTIFDAVYALPIIQSSTSVMIEGGKILLGFYNEHPLIHINQGVNTTGEILETYDLTTPSAYLLENYWQLTSRDAVKNAAGVIRLFFEEVEKEKQTHVLRDGRSPVLQQASTRVVRIAFGGVEAVTQYASRTVTNTLLAIASHVTGVKDASPQIVQKTGDTIPTASPVTIVQKMLTEIKKPSVTRAGTLERSSVDLTLLVTQLIEARAVLESIAANIHSQGRGLGEVAGASTTTQLTSAVIYSGIVSPPPPPVRIDYGVPQGSAPFVPPPPPIPASTTPPAIIPPADTTLPDAPSILNFQGAPFVASAVFSLATTSIVIDGEAEASSTLTLLIVEDATTTVHFYDVGTDGLWSFTSTLVEGTSTLLFTSTDEAGNVSSSTDIVTVIALPPPPPPPPPADPVAPFIRFSEVAWSGTVSFSSDEWIELHNRTDDPISLDGLLLRTADGGLSIPLSGTIDPRQYFVIAATPDLFSNLAVQFVAPFGDGLDDAGEGLELVRTADATLIESIPYCLNWCDVGRIGGLSMLTDVFEDPVFHFEYWTTNGQSTNIRDRAGVLTRGLPGEGTENLIAN